MKEKQKSLENAKRKKIYLMAGIILFLAGLFFFSLMTGNSSEKEKADKIKNEILSAVSKKGESVADIAAEGLDNLIFKNHSKIPDEKLKDIEKQMGRISPEARKQVIKSVAMARIEEVKEKIKNMSNEEREEFLRKTLEKVRDSFSNMNDKERQRVKEMLDSPQGKEDMESTLNSYFTDLSSEDRQAMDPVMYEIGKNLNNL